jgi:peroxiredoxin
MPSKKMNNGMIAPDFELLDTRGQTIRLSEYHKKKIIVLIFMRGFA